MLISLLYFAHFIENPTVKRCLGRKRETNTFTAPLSGFSSACKFMCMKYLLSGFEHWVRAIFFVLSTVPFVLWLLAARKSYGTFTTQTLALGPCIRNVYLSFIQFVIQSPFIHRLSSYCSLPNIGYTLCISLV